MAPLKNKKKAKNGDYCITTTETKIHERMCVANSTNAWSQPNSIVRLGHTNGKIIERIIHECKIEHKTNKKKNETAKKKSTTQKRKIKKNTKMISKRGGAAGKKGRKQSIDKRIKKKVKSPKKITFSINL